MSVKIHKSYFPELENADHNLLQAAKASVSHFENQYAILDFNIDYREFDDTPKIKKTKGIRTTSYAFLLFIPIRSLQFECLMIIYLE